MLHLANPHFGALIVKVIGIDVRYTYPNGVEQFLLGDRQGLAAQILGDATLHRPWRALNALLLCQCRGNDRLNEQQLQLVAVCDCLLPRIEGGIERIGKKFAGDTDLESSACQDFDRGHGAIMIRRAWSAKRIEAVCRPF